jgi:ATP-dependent Clp protease ATP-binding subunit ClpC
VFKPELLNRIDEIVPFHNLEPAHVRAIVDLLIGETQQRMQEQATTLQVSDEARNLLARHGYDPAYGARALRRTVQSLLDDMLAESLLQAAYSPGDTIVVSVADGHLLAKPEATKSSKERPAA